VPTKNTIRAKRRTVSPKALREKRDRGELTGRERALVRVGKTSTKVLTGEDDLSEWDDEELRRGRRRAASGNFRGADPKVVPKALHDELVRRTMDKAAKLLHDSLEAAVQVLCELVLDPDIEAKDRLRAVQMIMDRTMGKAPDKVEVTADMKPWEIALRGGIVNTGSADDEDE
jgi:hypothetical protein